MRTTSRYRTPLIVLTGVCLAMALASACGSSDDEAKGLPKGVEVSPDPALKAALPVELRGKNGIDVAAVTDYAPLSFFDEGNTEIIGFNIDLLNAAATVLGVKFKYKDTSFDSLIPSLQSGRVLFAEGGASDTPEAEKASIMVTYLTASAELAVKPENPAKITSLADACGHRVATLAGSVRYMKALTEASAACEKAAKPKIEISTFKTADQGLLAVTAGRADAMFESAFANAYRIGKGVKVKTIGPKYNPTLIGFQVAKGKTQVADALRQAVQKLIDNGVYKKLVDKWGLPGAVERVQINPATTKN